MEFYGLVIDAGAIIPSAMVYLIQFSIFTVLAYIARRRNALHWDLDLLKSARVNWSFIFVNSLLAPAVLVLTQMADTGFRESGIPRLSEEFWLFAPAIVPALAALVVADFVEYWSHRLRHVSVLWPMHAVHQLRHQDALSDLVPRAHYRNGRHSGRLCLAGNRDGRLAVCGVGRCSVPRVPPAICPYGCRLDARPAKMGPGLAAIP